VSKKLLIFLISLVLLVACSVAPAEPTATAVPAPTPTPEWILDGWELVWQDEFDGETINADSWTHEVGGDGWGNGEAQYYTDDPKNAYVADGHLNIVALKENFLGKLYTSARLTTQDKVEVEYGRIEARIQIPEGQGLWPAFWMLGNDLPQVGWPFAGEIDIMENVGHEPSTIHGTVHGPGYFGGNGVGGPKNLPGGQRYADDFHIFAIEWEEDEIRWYMDDELYFKVTPNTVPGEWVYDHPFYMILNVAVGGEWPGYPDGTATFPQTMKVDYVRIYEQSTGE
jgi:beta-glucanase (GH16 family)